MSDEPVVAVSLDDMIRCAGRQLGMRRTVYPKFIARMKQDEADREIARMDAIYATLKALKASRKLTP